jgi:hypothetical protein
VATTTIRHYNASNIAYDAKGNDTYGAGERNEAYDRPEGNAAYAPPANATTDPVNASDPAVNATTNRY